MKTFTTFLILFLFCSILFAQEENTSYIPQNIINIMKVKSSYEQAIKDEIQASEEYGVINLSLIDSYKQEIIKLNRALKIYLAEYKRIFKKNFNKNDFPDMKPTMIILYTLD